MNVQAVQRRCSYPLVMYLLCFGTIHQTAVTQLNNFWAYEVRGRFKGRLSISPLPTPVKKALKMNMQG